MFVLCFASSRGADAGSAPPPAPIRRRLGVFARRRRRRGRERAGCRNTTWGTECRNRGRAGESAPIDRESAEALAEASAAAAAEKDAAPGEPEEGTPKLKPRADTFDGPAL